MFPIEAFRATLERAICLFEEHGIRFHLTGGIASVYYGEPRMTQDIDIVVDNSQMAAGIDSFVSSLEESEFMFDPNSLRQAVGEQGMFQLLDGIESLKLDIYPRELIPGELDRSVLREVFENRELPLASCADVGASKLVWISKGSHKSRRDLRQLFRFASRADQSLIEELADQLGLTSLLAEVLDESDEMN